MLEVSQKLSHSFLNFQAINSRRSTSVIHTAQMGIYPNGALPVKGRHLQLQANQVMAAASKSPLVCW